jgi:hypothetical protein
MGCFSASSVLIATKMEGQAAASRWEVKNPCAKIQTGGLFVPIFEFQCSYVFCIFEALNTCHNSSNQAVAIEKLTDV